jgi:glycine cleavage system protein P-like pyridoxal-binding family
LVLKSFAGSTAEMAKMKRYIEASGQTRMQRAVSKPYLKNPYIADRVAKKIEVPVKGPSMKDVFN